MPGEILRSIHDAVRTGDVKELTRMVKNGASINEVDDKEKFTPLHWACALGALECVHWLLWQRADATVRAPRGWTPAHIAAIRGQDACMKALINNGVGMDNKDLRGATPAHLAAAHGNSFTLQTVMRAGVDIDTIDKNGWSPLLLAAYHGRLGCVQILAKWGAKIDEIDSNGNTAAHLAAMEGHLPVLKYLVSAGPSSTHVLSSRNDQGETPKMLAQQFYKEPIVEYITHVEWERDRPEEADTLSFPAHLAASTGDLDHLRMLIENGVVNINERDEHGASLLHKAAGQGHVHVIQWLIEMGAHREVQNDAGETARDVARRFGQLGALRLLGPGEPDNDAAPGEEIVADPPYGNSEGDGIEFSEKQIQEAQARAKKKIQELEHHLEIAQENYKQLGGKLTSAEKKRIREIRERDRKQQKQIEELESQLEYERVKREKLEGQLDEYRREIAHLNAQLEQYDPYQPSDTTMKILKGYSFLDPDRWDGRPPRHDNSAGKSRGATQSRKPRNKTKKGRGSDNDGVFIVRRKTNSLDRSTKY